jgi:hypothetical protein
LGLSGGAIKQAREQVARVLLAFSLEKDHRGTLLQAGGGKILVSLYNKNTEKGLVTPPPSHRAR